MNKLENLRVNYNIAKPDIININNELTLPFKDPIITKMRINNYSIPKFYDRIVQDLEEIEQERLREYGEKVDISVENIVEKMKQTMVSVPQMDDIGNVINYPNSNDPILLETSLFSLLQQLPNLSNKQKIQALDNGINDMRGKDDMRLILVKKLAEILITKQNSSSFPTNRL